jgi:serine kinase of HPr protein (carbohydrate metabolism regulator)
MGIANVHASCVVLGQAGACFGAPDDWGVLILGESGSGKSDLALRLLERGARLVADDRVDLFVRDDRLRARPPASLAGLLEIRGVGIVAFPCQPDAAIRLVIRLVSRRMLQRLPDREEYLPPPSLELPQAAYPPLLRLCAFEGSAAAKVAAAAAAFAQALFRDNRNLS